jgi:hypothetical protein
MNHLISECRKFFEDFKHPYAVCGGYALELFTDTHNRPHSDLDITVFREDKQNIIAYVQSKGWNIYEPKHHPDSLRLIADAEHEVTPDCLCLWAVKPGCSLIGIRLMSDNDNMFSFEIKNEEQSNFDFIEIIFNVKTNGCFVCDAAKGVLRELDKAILYRHGIPYLAPEIILFFISDPAYTESAYHREKSNIDWNVTPPHLSQESLNWLIKALKTAYPDGNRRLENLGDM